jgi:hypothetical protein
MKKKEKVEMVRVKAGKWYPVQKEHVHVCCWCSKREQVEMKTSKNGVIWMKWTPIVNHKRK